MSNAPELEQLRKTWLQRTLEPATDPCPQAGKIWEALDGTLSRTDLHAIVRHTAVCPTCAQLWRLAHELGAMLAKNAEVVRLEQKPSRPMPALALAAGLVLLIGLGLVFWQWQPGKPASTSAPSYRAGEQASLESLVSESEPISRTACKLAWTPGPRGTRYNVRVTTAELIQVYLAQDLTSPGFLVPPDVLAEFPPGTRLMWQIEAVMPGGQRTFSPTYFLTLE